MTAGAGLTRRGWVVLVSALGLGAGAYLFGIVELYPLGAGAVVLVAAARAWVGAATWDVRVARTVRPARVAAGTEARVAVSARNHDSRRSPVVTVIDRFDHGGAAAAFCVAPLKPGESRAASYHLPAARRGLYRLLPLEVELSDPFGMARTSRVGAPAAVLTVHPMIEPLPRRSVPSDSDRDRRVPLPVLGRGGDEFYGLREYQAGDDLRHIHWASTARVDELMVRQPENLWRGRTTIVIDGRAVVHTPATFEAVLSAAASLASSTLRAGMQARVVVTGGTDTGFGSGAGHEASILDTLAVAKGGAGGTLGEELVFAGLGGPLVLLTTDAANPAETAAVLRRAGRSSSALVTFGRDHRSSPAGIPTGSSAGVSAGDGARRCRRVFVPAGASFRSSWAGGIEGGGC